MEKKNNNNNTFFTQTLLQWFAEFGRSLPWRETKNPYAIWLSEIILQQTRIQQGWTYWERFMQRFPTIEALACLLYTSPSPRDISGSRMPSSA